MPRFMQADPRLTGRTPVPFRSLKTGERFILDTDRVRRLDRDGDPVPPTIWRKISGRRAVPADMHGERLDGWLDWNGDRCRFRGSVPVRRVPRARFLVWTPGGDVVLTLDPGQSLERERGGPTEEGWYRQSETWTHCGDHVRAESVSDGCDCDGRLTDGRTSFVPLDRLRSGPGGRPEFMSGAGWRRDYAAERAGY